MHTTLRREQAHRVTLSEIQERCLEALFSDLRRDLVVEIQVLAHVLDRIGIPSGQKTEARELLTRLIDACSDERVKQCLCRLRNSIR